MTQLFLNNFESTFVASVNNAPVTGTPATELDYGILRISDGAAGMLINPVTDYYLLTAYKQVGTSQSNLEILKVTAVNNAVPGECRITVLRGQEGTPVQAYVAGDHISMRLTKGGLENLTQDAELTALSSAVTTSLSGKQATLVSGTNIKTVGGVSLLGGGDVSVGGLTVVIVSTTTQTAVANNHYVLTNGSATTVTLPATPASGDTVWVTVANSLTTNVIARNGQTIMGVAEDMTIDNGNATVELRFVNSSWRLV